MICEPSTWKVWCEYCSHDADIAKMERDLASYFEDEESLVKYLVEDEGWVYDEKEKEIFCCEECHAKWLEENK